MHELRRIGRPISIRYYDKTGGGLRDSDTRVLTRRINKKSCRDG